MWRIFRWLDRHPPSFYKFSVMLAGLAGIACTSFLLGRWHPAAGILFGFGTCFALLRASHVYRFEKKPKPPSERDLPISEASEEEILRRVNRHARTERVRRLIRHAGRDKKKEDS